MIVFLNFTPISFMGGSEKWISEIASSVNQYEDVVVIDVHAKIANFYGKAILKRTFENHRFAHKTIYSFSHLSLTYRHFIPFTKEWKLARKYFKDSRLIYERFEFLEIGITMFFGGVAAIRKTVAGLILTPEYASPRGIVDKIHNVLYSSHVYKYLLLTAKKVHVMNIRDKDLLEKKYKVKKIITLPASIEFPQVHHRLNNSNKEKLSVLYVGELSTRKGVDTIIDIINKSPQMFEYHIVGKGPLQKEIKMLHEQKKCHYYGYLSVEKLQYLYSRCDTFLFPSRSEAFGIVMAEAMSFGEKIICSTEVSLQLPIFIENNISDRNAEMYIGALQQNLREKQSDKIDRKKIIEFAKEKYSRAVVHEKFISQVIN